MPQRNWSAKPADLRCRGARPEFLIRSGEAVEAASLSESLGTTQQALLSPQCLTTRRSSISVSAMVFVDLAMPGPFVLTMAPTSRWRHRAS